MVDDALISAVKEKIDAGADSASPDDIMTMFKLYKAIAAENEDLKEELEDMDIAVQMIITDQDKKFWITAKEGDLEYGDGEVDNPSFTFSATMAVGAGMLYGEVDATSAYMAGDITVEGNLQDAMAFQEIIELAMEAFEDIAE
ncbi:MAG: SCP2 sterol-binding domain-containing protein [Promethearchaeota archaeon]|nr:MAG: SCP2 sterol-binding domain-containing protein [Candidatus Lokiarchaeota archaeon]